MKYETIKKALMITSGLIVAGLVIYGACIMIPALVAQAAGAGATAAISSIPGIGGYIASTSVGTQIATVATGEAYIAITALPCFGLSVSKVAIAGSAGMCIGKNVAEFVLTAGERVASSWGSKIQNEKLTKSNLLLAA